MNHEKTPYLDALKEYLSKEVSPFDVPGHHMGNVPNKLKDFLGKKVFEADVNAPIGMDNLAHPSGVILETYKYLNDATGADKSFILINGTSSGIIASILSICKNNDKIILPRNVHKSVISALVLSGAVPVYVMPEIDMNLEIANQPSLQDYKKTILRYPSAKAIFVINPTYFGGVTNLKELVEFAHRHNMAVIVDEAHGAHFYFNEYGPDSAMKAGADISSVSFHKTAGSLTQSSVLLLRDNGYVDVFELQKSLNMINTTSPSTLLIASVDAARSYLALHGQEKISETIELANYAREQISKIKGFIPRGKEHFLKHGCYDFDETKLVIELDRLDIDGFELYKLLKKDYDVQMELAETYGILAIFAIGTKKSHVRHLINALKDISKKHYDKNRKYPTHSFETEFPFSIISPRIAFGAPSKLVKIDDAENSISHEQIMIYPPGIPLIVSGEVFTSELIKKIKSYKNSNVTVLSDYGADLVSVIDIENWKTHNAIVQKKLDDYFPSRLTNPRNDGYKMPFEGDKHEGTLMLLPFRKDTWRNNATPALKNYKEVILAIAKYEKVYVGIHPRIYNRVIKDFEDIKNVIPMKISYNDSWARDNMPIFVKNSEGKTRCVDFRFNAWGGEVDGLYSNYKDDDKISSLIAKKFNKLSYYHQNFVLEGGSIHVDGEGTCLVTEACLLSEGRNPNFTKSEIEETLKINLNVEKVIWLKHGIYLDETNEHIDNVACFIRPGEVALAWTNDKDDPQYQYSLDAYNTLKKETDAKGRKLIIHKVLLPKPQYMSVNEAKGIKIGKYNAVERLAGARLSASYVNFYQGDKFVILPAFNDPSDELAKKQLEKLYPDKEIIQIYSREILLGGGNIHCITMQIPKEEK